MGGDTTPNMTMVGHIDTIRMMDNAAAITNGDFLSEDEDDYGHVDALGRE